MSHPAEHPLPECPVFGGCSVPAAACCCGAGSVTFVFGVGRLDKKTPTLLIYLQRHKVPVCISCHWPQRKGDPACTNNTINCMAAGVVCLSYRRLPLFWGFVLDPRAFKYPAWGSMLARVPPLARQWHQLRSPSFLRRSRCLRGGLPSAAPHHPFIVSSACACSLRRAGVACAGLSPAPCCPNVQKMAQFGPGGSAQWCPGHRLQKRGPCGKQLDKESKLRRLQGNSGARPAAHTFLWRWARLLRPCCTSCAGAHSACDPLPFKTLLDARTHVRTHAPAVQACEPSGKGARAPIRTRAPPHPGV